MFHKDTLRLIKRTFNRFFSLVMIVLIGVAFMMGLLSTREIMESSVDRYADEYDLQDLQIYSSYGFDEEDVEAIKQLDYVDKVFASKLADVYAESEDGQILVIRVEETARDVDRFELIDGRLPEKEGEAVILDSGMTKGTFKTGKTLRLYLEDQDILETLSTDRFTIVGIIKTPAYMSKTLGTGTLKNLDIQTVIYAPSECFLADYYTSVYLTFKDAAALDSFSAKYTDLTQIDKEEFESFAKKQQDVRKDKLLDEYKEEIAEGEKTLEEKKTEGQQQLDEAKQQLEDARIQIIAGETQLTTLEEALSAVLTQQRAIRNEYDNGSGPVYNRIAEIESKDEQGRRFEDIYYQTAADKATVDALKQMLEEADETAIPTIEAAIAEIEGRYESSLEDLNTEYAQLFADKLRYDAMAREIEIAAAAESRIRGELSRLRYTLAQGKQQYEEGRIEYENGVRTFNAEIEKAELDIRKAKQQLDELPDASWMLLGRDSHYSTVMYSQNAKQMGAIGISLPLLFYLVAALVCLTTMTRLVDEQRGQIGVFRALGFSRGKIVAKYVIYALTATLAGSVAGIFLGMAIFPTVIYNTWRLMYDLPEMMMYFPWQNVVICLLAFSLLMAGVTVYVVNRTLREMPSQLMRPKPPKNAKKVFLEKIPFIWKRFSFTGKITVRNLIRYRARALMTIIGVAGCTALLVVGWGIKDSISDVVALQFGQIFDYDYTVNLEKNAETDELLEVLGQDLQNEKVVPYMSYTSKVYRPDDEPTLNVVVIDAREGSDVYALTDAYTDKELRIRNSGVIISQKFAENNGIKAGDYITIESASGLKASVKVNAICHMYFQHYLYISEDCYDSSFDEPLHYTAIALRNPAEPHKEIESYIKDIEGYSSITDFSSLADQFNTMLNALDFIILVIIITAGALAFVVLINLSQVNISERIREIATLKVLGFHNVEVDSYIFKEIFLLSLAGALLGMPLGVVEHHFIMNVINMEMIMFGMQVKPLSFIWAFAVTVGFTVIVLLMMIRPLKRVQMVESLKSVE